MKVSVTCPHCRSLRSGERARFTDSIVTLCYCHTCGVTWTREADAADEEPRSIGRRERRAAAPPDAGPNPGDLLLRGSVTDGYELIDAGTRERIASGLSTLEEVVAVARQHGGEIWQQQADRRGRPMGKPIRLSLQAQ